MLIETALKNIHLLSEKMINGKYVMQDDILYRSTGFNELYNILTKKGFTPTPGEPGSKRSDRADSVVKDFKSEKKRLLDIERDDVQMNRKLKLPKGKAKGWFKSFSRSLNDFLSINFANLNNKVIIAFYKEPLKNLRGAKLRPLGWLINHYDNYAFSNDTYISNKNELEDRLYYTGDFLPFNSSDLTKYIKAIYINPDNITADKAEKFKTLLSLIKKENIDIRWIGKNVDMNNLTHLGLQKAMSNKEIRYFKGAGKEADKDKDPVGYKKWAKTKEKYDNVVKDLENANPLEYYTYNKVNSAKK